MLRASDFRDRILFRDFVFQKGRFKKLLDPTLDTKPGSRHVHRKTFTHFIMDENDKLMVDYVGRFENLKNDWEFICKQMGTKIKLSHINKRRRKDNKHYRDYYNDETKAHIAETYKKDLELFGYEF
jgi:hypothetical protein